MNSTYNGTINVTQGTGVSLTNNTGTNNFGGTLTLSTGTNPAFAATGGGTVNVTGSSNTLTTTTATALNISNTTIGASNLNFRSITTITASGNAGIVLNNTGTGGGLTVTGTGTTAGSGGSISNKTGNGVELTNTRNVSLSYMTISSNLGTGDFNPNPDVLGGGVVGTNVTNFSLIGSNVSNNGNTQDGTEAGLRFQNLLGVSTITNSTFNGQPEDHVRITSDSGTLTNLTVTGSAFNAQSTPTGGHGISWLGTNTAVGTVTVSNSTFQNVRSTGVIMNLSDTSRGTLSVNGNTFTDTGVMVTMGTAFSADLNFTITNNTGVRAISNAIQLVAGSTSLPASQINGTVSGNTVGNGTPDSGSRDAYGIAIDMRGDQDAIIKIDNNNIRNTDINGIWVTSADFGTNTGTNGILDLTLTNNTVSQIDDNSSFPFFAVYGTLVDVRNTTTACVNMSSNTSTGVGGLEHFRVRQRDTSVFRLERLTDNDGTPNGINANIANVEAFVAAQNDAGSTADATLISGYTVAADGACRDVPFNIVGSDTVDNAKNNLNFQDRLYRSPSERLTSIEPFFKYSTDEAMTLTEEIALASDKAFVNENTNRGIDLTPIINDLQSVAVVFSEIFANISSSILPTVSAQESVETKMQNLFKGKTDAAEPLQAGVTICVDGNANQNDCAGGFTLPAGKSTTITFTAVVAANFIGDSISNTATVTAAGGINQNSTVNTTVVQPPTISKAFGASSISFGSTATLTFTVGNSNPSTNLTGIAFTDSLPSGLVVANPNGLINNCGGGSVSAAADSNSIVVSALSRNAATACTIVVNVRATAVGEQNNLTGNIASTQSNAGGKAAATLTVTNPTISGTILYGITPMNQMQKFVPRVTVAATGATSPSDNTNSLGIYLLDNLTPNGQYTVAASKTGDVNNISSFDATLVLRHVAANGQGANALIGNQLLAADANGIDGVTSFDATLILRYVAANGSTANTGLTGTWKFVPRERQYGSLTKSMANQDFEAVLIGEINGNWVAPNPLNATEGDENIEK